MFACESLSKAWKSHIIREYAVEGFSHSVVYVSRNIRNMSEQHLLEVLTVE